MIKKSLYTLPKLFKNTSVQSIELERREKLKKQQYII